MEDTSLLPACGCETTVTDATRKRLEFTLDLCSSQLSSKSCTPPFLALPKNDRFRSVNVFHFHDGDSATPKAIFHATFLCLTLHFLPHSNLVCPPFLELAPFIPESPLPRGRYYGLSTILISLLLIKLFVDFHDIGATEVAQKCYPANGRKRLPPGWRRRRRILGKSLPAATPPSLSPLTWRRTDTALRHPPLTSTEANFSPEVPTRLTEAVTNSIRLFRGFSDRAHCLTSFSAAKKRFLRGGIGED